MRVEGYHALSGARHFRAQLLHVRRHRPALVVVVTHGGFLLLLFLPPRIEFFVNLDKRVLGFVPVDDADFLVVNHTLVLFFEPVDVRDAFLDLLFTLENSGLLFLGSAGEYAPVFEAHHAVFGRKDLAPRL